MSREIKGQIIDKLQEDFTRCNIGILTDYRGLATSEMTALRRSLQESGGEYKVVKNTLARFAAERAGRDDLAGSFVGPVAIAFGYDDIVVPAKVLANYINETKVELGIKGGFLSNKLLTAEDVVKLSTLPPREILLAQVLGGMINPISALLNCLTSPLRGIAGVLQARISQLEGE